MTSPCNSGCNEDEINNIIINEIKKSNHTDGLKLPNSHYFLKSAKE